MIELAGLSGDFIRPFFGRADVKVELKADRTPVTVPHFSRNPPGSELNFRVFRAIPGFKHGVNLDPYRAFMIELAGLSGDFIRPFFGRADEGADEVAAQSG